MSAPHWVTRICGRNARSTDGTTAWKARSQPASSVPGGSGTLTALPSAPGAAGLVGEAGAGEQGQRGLVQADREHPRVVVEDRLHAVAVVHVDVHIGDPLARRGRAAGDGHRRVVVDAEPGGAGAASRGAARRRRSPRGGPRPRQTASAAARVAPATSALASCIRSKTGLSAVPRPVAGEERVVRGGPDRVEVVRVVHPGQRGVVGRLGRDHASPRAGRARPARGPARWSARPGPGRAGGRPGRTRAGPSLHTTTCAVMRLIPRSRIGRVAGR